MKINKNYFHALATMIGYVVGVGMFGIPFLAVKSGLIPFVFLLIALAFIQYLVHVIYANIIIATPSEHLLPGYTGIYLGKSAKTIVFIANLFSNIGALLAYIIVNGIFVNQLLSPYFGGNEFFYATIIFALEATVVYFGIRTIAKFELLMTAGLLFVIAMIVWRGVPYVQAENFSLINPLYFFLPYGALLFSLDGSGCLPLLSKLLNKDKVAIKSVIRLGIAIPTIIILAFTVVIVGISGVSTSADALSGVKSIIDDGVVTMALVFGVLAITTSFFGVAESMRKILNWDYKINSNLAWAITVFVPYFLYFSGIKNLAAVISVVGAIGGGLASNALILIYRKIRKQKNMLPLFPKFKPGKLITNFLLCIFGAGVIYEIWGIVVNNFL